MQSQCSEEFAGVPAPAISRYERCFLCPCNAGACLIYTSNTPANPGRKFYTCSARDKCTIGKKGFFKWVDTVRADELIDVPYCGGCMAGLCRVRREKSGPNAGRLLFMCSVKEGEGSCGYRVWQDELEKLAGDKVNSTVTSSPSSLAGCNGTTSLDIKLVREYTTGKKTTDDKADSTVTSSPSSSADCNGTTSPDINLVKEHTTGKKTTDDKADSTVTSSPSSSADCNGTTSPDINLVKENTTGKKATDDKADSTATSSPSSSADCNGTTSPDINLVEENSTGKKATNDKSPVVNTSRHLWHRGATSRKMKQLNHQEDDPGESSNSPNKRLRYGDFKAPTTTVAAHSSTICLVRKSVLVKQHWWMTVAIRKDLGPQLRGWWGRLAFHPLPGLIMPGSNPSTCCISCPLDPIKAQDVNLVRAGASITLIKNSDVEISIQCKPDCNAEVSSIQSCLAIDAPSCKEPCGKTSLSNLISESVSKAFGLAAELLQNDLLTLLESVDPKDHNAMTEAAKATFAALDRLYVNHQHLDKRVNELIQCAKSLSALEQSIPRNDHYQKLASKCDGEKLKLNEMNCAHAQTIDSVVSFRKLHKDLQDRVSSTKNLLYQMEEDLVCSEVELRTMEHKLEQISKEKEVVEMKYVIASKDLEDFSKLRELREAERHEAKAAFDKARALLRG